MLAGTPTWEDAVNLMRQDGPRGFRVDIETDSTIAADSAEEQQAITQLLEGITRFWTGIGPVVESGFVNAETVKAFTLAAVRRFKLGKVIEDAIDKIGEGQPPAPKGPTPEMLEAQYKMENLAFQKQQAVLDYDTKMRHMDLDQRDMEMKERDQQLRAQAEDLKTNLEHHRETQRLNLDAMTAAHDAAMERSRQNLEAVKTAGDHFSNILSGLAALHGKMEQGQRRRLRVHRDPKTNLIMAIEPEQETPPAPMTVQ